MIKNKKKEKKRRKALLPLLGILFAVAGFYLISRVEDYLGKIIDQELQKVATAACNCSYTNAGTKVSLLRLKAQIFRPTLSMPTKELRKTTGLSFQVADTRISLRALNDKLILLENLRLIGGKAEGFNAESVLFKFIDEITTSKKPKVPIQEKKWKVRVNTLKVINAELSQNFESTRIETKATNMDLVFKKQDHFILYPHIKELQLIGKKKRNSLLKVTDIKTTLHLRKKHLDFAEIDWKTGKSTARGGFIRYTKVGKKIKGKLQYLFNAEDLRLPRLFEGEIGGEAKLFGNWPALRIKGQLKGNSEHTINIKGLGQELFSFDQLVADYDVDWTNKNPILSVNKVNAGSNKLNFNMQEAIIVEDSRLAGKFNLESELLEIGNTSIANNRLSMSLGGTPENANYDLFLNSKRIHLGPFYTNDLKLEINSQNQNNQYNLSAENNSEALIQIEVNNSENKGQAPSLDELQFKAKNFPFFLRSKEDEQAKEKFFITGSGNFKDLIEPKKTKGNAKVSIASANLLERSTLNAELSLNNQVIKTLINNPNNTIFAELNIPIFKNGISTASVDLKNFQFSDYDPSIECGSVSAKINYKFEVHKVLAGNGNIVLDRGALGCQPYGLELVSAKTLTVNNGNIPIDNLQLKGEYGQFIADGNISLENGFNVKAKGFVELESFLKLTPSLDDLRGSAAIEIEVNGELKKPTLSGKASINEASFSIEALTLNAYDISGAFNISDNKVEIENLLGRVNQGRFMLIGTIDPLNMENSDLQLQINDLQIEPFDNTFALIDTTLQLDLNKQSKSQISGIINIKRGVIEQNINIASLLNLITRLFVDERSKTVAVSNLPEIELDVSVVADRDFQIITNFLETELSSNLFLKGTLSEPVLQGSLKTLAGWFGFKDKKFDITAGTIYFEPNSSEPKLDLIAEAVLDTPTGESILTILEAQGDLFAPQIILSADSNLSEQEILTLLTVSRRNDFETQINTIQKTGTGGGVAFIESKKNNQIQEFFHSLTNFDNLSLEPVSNIQSGLIEPTVVVEKKFNDQIALIGQSYLSNSTPGSKFAIEYNINEKLKLRTGLDTVSVQNQTNLTSDISYTLFAKKAEFLKIKIIGNEYLSTPTLLRKLRLTNSSRIQTSDLDNLKSAFLKIYNDEGFYNVSANTNCTKIENFNGELLCRKLSIVINEGSPCLLKDVIFTTETPPKIVKHKDLIKLTKKQLATSDFIERVNSELIRRLRNEGYIQARLRSEYHTTNITNDQCALSLDLTNGQAVSFSFSGNQRFSVKEFLETINLFERKQPFGNNTINILIQRIKKLYKDNGYLQVKIESSLISNPDDSRSKYFIQIEEGPVVEINNVVFKGMENLSESSLKQLVLKEQNKRYDSLFDPKYAKSDELIANTKILEQIYKNEGFPDVQVKHEIKLDQENSEVEVLYIVDEGAPIKADWLVIDNLPNVPIKVIEPTAPYSILKANRYLDKLISNLKDQGYLYVNFSSSLENNQQLKINIDAGQRTKINNIIIHGNQIIKTDLIEKKLNLNTGDYWIKNNINNSKKILLSLGLFSRVSISPLDGKLDEAFEDLLVEVLERPLETLQFGGGLHSELGVHFFGEASNKSWFADGRSLNFRVDTYYDPQEAEVSQGITSLSFKQPSAFNNLFDLNHGLRYQKIDLTTYEFDFDRYVFDNTIQRKFGKNITFTSGHSLLHENLNNVPADAVLTDHDRGTNQFGSISVTALFDQRDNPINPVRGYQFYLESNIANSLLGSNADYATLGSTFSYLMPLSSRFSFAQRLSSKAGWALDEQDTLPITQRFYSGGRTSVRGFRENSLGPRGSNGSVLGGDFSLINNLELRYKLKDTFELQTFLDAGNVYLQEQSVSLNDLRYSTGVGFRYLSPIGPIGISLGHPLEQEDGEPSVRLHFSVGSQF